MGTQPDLVQLLLTRDEAWELLSRCLHSEDPDDDAFRNALSKLAQAIREAVVHVEVA